MASLLTTEEEQKEEEDFLYCSEYGHEEDLTETNLHDETAWDLVNTIAKPEHDPYDVGDETKETIPIITNVLNQHGLHGLNTGDVIEIIGNEQSGKTHLLYQHLITCCLPSKIMITKSTKNKRPTLFELGGHNSKAIFFDLKLSFNINRLYDIFVMTISRKIIKHNVRIQNLPQSKTINPGAPIHRHSMPLNMNQLNENDIYIEKIRKRMVEIDKKTFLESYEGQLLWKLIKSKISLVRPITPIQLIISLHKFRSMLNAMYTNKHKNNNNKLYQFNEEFLNEEAFLNDDDDDDEDENEDEDEYEEDDDYTINGLINGEDNGMRLVLIDDINIYFNELTANRERDKYYYSLSALLMNISSEFGLIIIFTRFCLIKQETEWLKQLLPIIDIKIKNDSTNHFTLKSQEMFHKKFGRIELEKKPLFIMYLYRESMKYFDSTVTHPSISNDLYQGFGDNDQESINKERALYLTGNEEITRKWVQTNPAENLDPFQYIGYQQKQNRKLYGTSDYNIIRGVVITTNEFINKAMERKKEKHQDYHNVIIQKKMIKFHAKISDRTGFVYHTN